MSSLRPVEELLYHMRTVVRSGSDWEANFARSIVKHAKRPAWNPSEKQHQIMQRMVSEMFTHSGTNTSDDIDLIDRGDRHDAA
ncbi:hypothetical protein [Parasedimentitalea psychrophila]|uniref:Uncharacterized protein n=1 Tax=Parasedimentitalea psychrophila TaxID=2997337 RepID=A0A9Y2P569_9RHOB|nr:hypothetical protein [Parasedimentitalea psychrophila]WIY23673.1 hypothetical protein QPJ95_13555 [Parasedimentitalea psychrophila]